jgi:beta-lactamase regulating signal transducer with metallopeptidase domain
MTGLLWRVLMAVLAVVLVIALVPPIFRIIGLPLSPDLWLIVRVCVAGIALFYILRDRVV